MNTQTKIESQFAAIGVLPRDVHFNIAIAKFMNNGGSEDTAIAMVRSAYEKERGGHSMRAAKANHDDPIRSANFDDEGHLNSSYKDNQKLLKSSNGRGQNNGFMPETAKRGISASTNNNAIALKAAQGIARTVLDSFKVRDGRSIGDIQYCELEGLRFENAREAAVIRKIQTHYRNAPANATVRELIKESDLQRFIQTGAEVADV